MQGVTGRTAAPAIAFRAPDLIFPRASARRLMTDIETPCNKVCVVDPVSALCIGCGRSLSEIAGWIGFGAGEHTRIMAELPGRLATLGRAEAARSDPG
jgi:predicted Fe-S protein YdhL (DUF1289 family)